MLHIRCCMMVPSTRCQAQIHPTVESEGASPRPAYPSRVLQDDGPDWPALALAESQALVMGLVLGITNAAGHSANSG